MPPITAHPNPFTKKSKKDETDLLDLGMPKKQAKNSGGNLFNPDDIMISFKNNSSSMNYDDYEQETEENSSLLNETKSKPLSQTASVNVYQAKANM